MGELPQPLPQPPLTSVTIPAATNFGPSGALLPEYAEAATDCFLCRGTGVTSHGTRCDCQAGRNATGMPLATTAVQPIPRTATSASAEEEDEEEEEVARSSSRSGSS